jgi:hypothetical protein
MKTMTEVVADLDNTQMINESAIYENIITKLQTAKEEGKPIEEGLFGAMIGGVAGATLLPALMKAVCKVIGVDLKGQFGNLLTSRLVLTAVGAQVGWNK